MPIARDGVRSWFLLSTVSNVRSPASASSWFAEASLGESLMFEATPEAELDEQAVARRRMDRASSTNDGDALAWEVMLECICTLIAFRSVGSQNSCPKNRASARCAHGLGR